MENNTKKTLLINYPFLEIGGIESFLYKLIKHSISKKYRVIWYSFKKMRIADIYRDILDKIEVVHQKKNYFKLFDLENLRFTSDEEIYILSFNYYGMLDAISLSKKYKKNKLKLFYIVANTKGYFYYPEEKYTGLKKRIVLHNAKKDYKKWLECNALRFFHIDHATTVEKKYGLSIPKKKELVLKSFQSYPELNIDVINKKTKRDPFNIVTVSRFDFPHKNYLLGLIKDFNVLIERKHNLFLYIVGFGSGENIVKELINSLPDDTKKAIFLLGSKSEDELSDLMTNMHLNISVAGSVKCGAINGVPSIPARNFCTDKSCEVYGFLPESFDKIVSREEGLCSIEFIEEVITMSNKNYYDLCVKSYNAFNEKNIVNPDYIFEQNCKTVKKCLFFYWLNKVIKHFIR